MRWNEQEDDMLEMRPNCERCDRDLPADRAGAQVCSFECTFCTACAEHALQGTCPNCGGVLTPRPTRVGSELARHPASTRRVTGDPRSMATEQPSVRNEAPLPLVLRAPTAADEDAWSTLWQGYLAFYRTELDPRITARTWLRILDRDASLFARLAERDGVVVGFAIAVLHEGSWVDAPICYLEDLFVAPEARGEGIAAALIDELLALGRARGWSRLYWNTDADNLVARRLYDRYIAADAVVRYRLPLR